MTLDEASDTGAPADRQAIDYLSVPRDRFRVLRYSRGVRFAVILVLLAGCKVKEPPPITSSWYDGFEREDIGASYEATGDGYRITTGQLSAKGAHNHPLWLRKKLPRNVRIE